MKDDMNRIVPLDELDDFKVADEDPDVRGWDVFSADGRRIGEVDNLLVDTSAMKVRYLDIELDNKELGLEADRHVLLPVGYARLDDDDDRVIVDELQTSDLRNLPEYHHGPITRDYEVGVRQSLDRSTGTRTGGVTTGSGTASATGSTATGQGHQGADDFYEDRLFSDTRLTRRRNT
jgi:sporulation protein YlmC with PRC-barrel domain